MNIIIELFRIILARQIAVHLLAQDPAALRAHRQVRAHLHHLRVVMNDMIRGSLRTEVKVNQLGAKVVGFKIYTPLLSLYQIYLK